MKKIYMYSLILLSFLSAFAADTIYCTHDVSVDYLNNPKGQNLELGQSSTDQYVTALYFDTSEIESININAGDSAYLELTYIGGGATLSLLFCDFTTQVNGWWNESSVTYQYLMGSSGTITYDQRLTVNNISPTNLRINITTYIQNYKGDQLHFGWLLVPSGATNAMNTYSENGSQEPRIVIVRATPNIILQYTLDSIPFGNISIIGEIDSVPVTFTNSAASNDTLTHLLQFEKIVL